MAGFGKEKTGTDSDNNARWRWENIMSLPEDTPFHDMSTGKKYKRAMFKPLYKDGFERIVDFFQIIGTDEEVYVPFLRRLGDFKSCSIGGKVR
jgi:hypothetical protein